MFWSKLPYGVVLVLEVYRRCNFRLRDAKVIDEDALNEHGEGVTGVWNAVDCG